MSSRLAFSNIAWEPEEEPQVLPLLRSAGITGIEIAPTVLWPRWEGATPEAARAYRRCLEDEGFVVPALQAILFARPLAALFDPRGDAHFLDHLGRVAALAGGFGARVAVLGAPRQRDRGARGWDEALESAVPVLRRAASVFADHDCCLCIEPNPARYGCNFVLNSQEGAALVEAVDAPGFGLHLDAAALYLEGESLAAVWPRVGHLVRHFHVSEPELGDFRAAVVPHASNFAVLESAGYGGWCSIEMRRPAGPLADHGPWDILGRLRGGGGNHSDPANPGDPS
jgi:sugar phosphate isomerase/epimerase